MKKILGYGFCVMVLGFVLLAAGCGYTTRSAIANKYRTIYIDPFVNKINITSDANVGSKYRLYRPLLETDVTRAVVNKFLFDGNLKPVKTGDADLRLNGELIEFRKDPLRYDDNDNVTEYRVNIVVNISLWSNAEKRQLWIENGFTGETSYFETGNQKISEAQAVNNSIADLARRIVERAVEEW